MGKINVLVFPDGEINSVEIHDALAFNVNIELYGASSVERHGRYLFERHIAGLPSIFEEDFYERLNEVIEKNRIDVIIPTHDTVSLELIKNKDSIKCKVLGGDLFTAETCRSKRLTYKLFEDCDFIPKCFEISDEISFPVFVKPDMGQGAKGTCVVNNYNELAKFAGDEYVICEYLPGEEYTVDCLTDKNGNLSFVSPRSRQRMLAGVCVHGKCEVLTDDILDIASTINSRLNFCGLWYFQIKRDNNGRFKLLEISNRCAGTMCLSRGRGVNLPLLSVYAIMGYDIKVCPNSYRLNVDRTLINRYEMDYRYKSVYIDLDDTIIVNGKVNLNAIRFIYQCRNKKIPIYLLTKHAFEVEDTLSRNAIDIALFDRIIHIPENKRKSDFIESDDPIFIDNAFSERYDVLSKKIIPVFDVDTIEVLLDWQS